MAGLATAVDFAEDDEDERIDFVKPTSMHLQKRPLGAATTAGYQALLGIFAGSPTPAEELDRDDVIAEDELPIAAKEDATSHTPTDEELIEHMLNVRADWVLQQEALAAQALTAEEASPPESAAASCGTAGSGESFLADDAPGGSSHPLERCSFEPSARFVGTREGMVFKLGDRGVGYYCDGGGRGGSGSVRQQAVEAEQLAVEQAEWDSLTSSATSHPAARPLAAPSPPPAASMTAPGPPAPSEEERRSARAAERRARSEAALQAELQALDAWRADARQAIEGSYAQRREALLLGAGTGGMALTSGLAPRAVASEAAGLGGGGEGEDTGGVSRAHVEFGGMQGECPRGLRSSCGQAPTRPPPTCHPALALPRPHPPSLRSLNAQPRMSLLLLLLLRRRRRKRKRKSSTATHRVVTLQAGAARVPHQVAHLSAQAMIRMMGRSSLAEPSVESARGMMR